LSDEAWSFVNNKGNKQWKAFDAKKEILGVYIGDRSSESALKLWNSLPPVYRKCAVCYTDFWDADQGVIPAKRHKAVGKDSGKTNRVEKFNNTMRQRISRLVRNSIFLKESRKSYRTI